MNALRIPRRLGFIFAALALVCWASYQWIGSSLDASGQVHEPFALIPIGWLSLLLAVVCGLVYLVLHLRKTK